MLANTFALHPADAALGAAARLQQRGDDPMIMVDAGNTFYAGNATWVTATPNYGPGGETGIAEAEVEKALMRVIKPLDDAARAIPVLDYAMTPDTLQRV